MKWYIYEQLDIYSGICSEIGIYLCIYIILLLLCWMKSPVPSPGGVSWWHISDLYFHQRGTHGGVRQNTLNWLLRGVGPYTSFSIITIIIISIVYDHIHIDIWVETGRRTAFLLMSWVSYLLLYYTDVVDICCIRGMTRVRMDSAVSAFLFCCFFCLCRMYEW